MINLLDDFYHVQQACELLRVNPDRKLIAALHCMMGENSDHSRILGLVLTFGLAALSFEVFVRPFRKLGDSSSKLSFLLIALHPMVAFSYIYASQLSTTVTCLWAVGWLATWNWVFKSQKPKIYQIFIGLAFSSLAGLMRMEAWVYAWIVFGFYWFLEREWGVPGRSNSRRLLELGLASLPALVRPQWIAFLYSVFRTDSITHVLPTGGGNTAESVASVSWGDWWVTQSYAVWVYLRNFLFPHIHSFYGPWHRSWQILQGWERFVWPILTGAVFLGAGWVWIRGKWRGLPPRWLLWVLVAVLLPSFILSAVPRNDWYSPSRQMLGSLLGLCALMVFCSKKVWVYLVLFFGAALSLVPAWHYSTQAGFFEAERIGTWGNPHPWVELSEGTQLIREAKYSEAIPHFYRNYQSISNQQLQGDQRSGLYWSTSLYYAWLSYEKLAEHEKSHQILRILMRSTFYPATLACLQDDRIETSRCLSPDRVSAFCTYVGNIGIPRLITLKALRHDPCQKHEG